MIDVVTMGDAVFDMIPIGKSDKGFLLFERNPGGSAVNVAGCVARLGGKGAFLGAVSADPMGDALISELTTAGLETSGIHRTDRGKTTIAMIAQDENRDRSFVMYPGRGMAADAHYQLNPKAVELLQEASVFHFTSPAQMQSPIDSALAQALAVAKVNGKMVSYDPNLRVGAWADMNEAVRRVKSAFASADILKLSDGEFEWFLGSSDYEKDSGQLLDLGVKLLCVSLGGKGCYFRTQHAQGFVPGFSVQVQDTTGAGDAFFGSLLFRIVKRGGLDDLKHDELEDMFRFANASGAICATRSGALSANPTLAEVQMLMHSVQN